jgi:hypothetical protein
MAGTFPSLLAQDSVGNIGMGITGQVYDVDDVTFSTPLSIFDLNGAALPGNQLVSAANGVLPGFSCPGYTVVRWKSGSYIMDIPCIDQVPGGGSVGQVLAKLSSVDFDADWITPPTVPAGGLTGQALVKATDDDYATTWANIAGAVGGGDFINVKTAGAVGDGVTDDYGILQSVLNGVDPGGSCVYFPPGDYRTSQTLKITVDSTLILGAGAGNRSGATQGGIGSRVRALAPFTGTEVFQVQRTANDRPVFGSQFMNIAVNGNSVTGIDGILFRSNQGSMTNVHIWACPGAGLRVKGYTTPGAWDTYDARFCNMLVGYCGSGAFLDTGGADTQWVNCVFLSNTNNYIVKASSPQVTNCHFYTGGQYNIWFDGGGSRAKFTGCKIEGAIQHGVFIDTTNGGYSDIQFTGNGFSTTSQSSVTNTYDLVNIAGPSGTGAGRVTFVGNSFNMKGGSTIKSRYAINLSTSAAQNTVILANAFGPTSHWGTGALNQASNSSLLPHIRGNWGVPDLVLANVQTASYTPVYNDTDTVLEMNSATAVTVTIPPNSTSGLMKGATLRVLQVGAGQVTIAAGAGVTLRSPKAAPITTRAQWSEIRLRQRITNEWVVDGDIT